MSARVKITNRMETLCEFPRGVRFSGALAFFNSRSTVLAGSSTKQKKNYVRRDYFKYTDTNSKTGWGKEIKINKRRKRLKVTDSGSAICTVYSCSLREISPSTQGVPSLSFDFGASLWRHQMTFSGNAFSRRRATRSQALMCASRSPATGREKV